MMKLQRFALLSLLLISSSAHAQVPWPDSTFNAAFNLPQRDTTGEAACVKCRSGGSLSWWPGHGLRVKGDSGTWSTVTGGGGSSTPVVQTNHFWVDRGTTASIPDGSLNAPYTTIQAAINSAEAVPSGASVQTIDVVGGDYPEALSIAIAGKRLVFLAHGEVNLGTFAGANWTPSGTRRDVVFTGNGSFDLNGITPSVTFARAEGGPGMPHGGWRISGKIDQTAITSTGPWSFVAHSVHVFGSDGTSTGDAWLGPATLGANNRVGAQLYESTFDARVTGNLSITVAADSSLLGAIDIYSIAAARFTAFGANVTTSVQGSVQPGLVGCSVIGAHTWTAPAGTLYLDPQSNYVFQLSGWTFSGPSLGIVSLDVARPYLARSAVDLLLTDSDYLIDATGSSSFSVVLPDAVGRTGREYVVRNSGTGTISLTTTGSHTQTLDGASPPVAITAGRAVAVRSTGANWVTVAESGARAPAAHASSHKDGGSDEVATITPGNGAIPKAMSSGKLATNWVPDMGGDSGSGGAHGLVPAPAAGDAAAGKFLKANGTWAAPAGGGGGGDALTTNPLSQFAATTSLQLAGVLSDEVGTGHFLLDGAIGSTLQAWDTDTDAAAGVTNAADTIQYWTGAHAAASTACGSVCRTLLAQTTVAAERTQLGLASLALLDTLDLAANVGSTVLPIANGGTASATASAAVDALGGAAATGSGGLVRKTGAALVAPDLGTPTALVCTACTGVSGITGLGTQAQALNMGSHLISNVTDPSSAQDAATKAYATNASNLASGTAGTARLGSGSATSSTVLHGDSSWSQVATGDIASGAVTSAKVDSTVLTTSSWVGRYAIGANQLNGDAVGGPVFTGAATITADKAMCAFLGDLETAHTVDYVRWSQTTAAGASTPAEVGVFSSPASANGSNQVLTPLATSGTLDSLTAGNSVVGNSAAFNSGSGISVAAGTHLWGCIHTNTSGAQPTLRAVPDDFGKAVFCTVASAGALTSVVTMTCVAASKFNSAATYPVMSWIGH
jgi:hypothetical protein